MQGLRGGAPTDDRSGRGGAVIDIQTAEIVPGCWEVVASVGGRVVYVGLGARSQREGYESAWSFVRQLERAARMRALLPVEGAA